jgi:transglutaminase-like putative cysteine protease
MTTLRLVWAAALLAIGAVALSAGWVGPVAMAVLVVGAMLPLAWFALGTRLRMPLAVSALLLLAAAAAGAYWLVLRPLGITPAEAARDSIPRLLTALRPAPPSADLLLPGVALALLTGTWVALRTVGGSTRGQGLVAAPVGAAVLYTAGALLTAGAADRSGILVGAIVVVAVAGWLLLDRPGPPVRIAAGRLAPVVALTGVAGVLLTLPVVLAAFEPRRLVDPPQRTIAEPSPLPRLAAWHDEGDVELLRVSAPPGTRLRLVTLGSYTGVAWSATASYRPLGTMADPTLPPGRRRTAVDASVMITTLDGLWLPSPGHPDRASLSEVDVEPESGSLALRSERLRPGLRYDVRGRLDTPRTDEVAAAGVPTGPAARPYLETPRLPWAFAEYARQVTFGASTPFEQAVAIEYAVRDGRRHDPVAPVGTSYARLEAFLFRDLGTEAGARVGSSEQFAAAFAVLARAVGLPTRVVLGFNTDGPSVGGMTSVRGRDSLAWPEVYFSGLGWYAFDPTPTAGARAEEEVKLLALDRMGEQIARARVPVASPSVPPRPSRTPAPVAAAPAGGAPPFATAGTVVATAGLTVLVLLAAARRVRTHRHRRRADQGAWSEVLDLLVLLGRRPSAAQPAPAVADDLAAFAPVRDKGPHPAAVVAAAADRAAFGPSPMGDAPVAAWTALRPLRKAVRAVVPWRRRLFWSVDPRPLLRRPPR